MSYKIDIENCLAALQTGGLILYPTDTIWGIGCDATNEAAIAKIYALKKRVDEKSMIILLANENDLAMYVGELDEDVFTHLKSVTKPTTVIYPNAKKIASNIINTDGSIAIRIVKDDFCLGLLKAFGKPIVSTSANISGILSPANFMQVSDEIKNGVDYIVQHRQNDLSVSSPSSIIKFNEDGSIKSIR